MATSGEASTTDVFEALSLVTTLTLIQPAAPDGRHETTSVAGAGEISRVLPQFPPPDGASRIAAFTSGRGPRLSRAAPGGGGGSGAGA